MDEREEWEAKGSRKKARGKKRGRKRQHGRTRHEETGGEGKQNKRGQYNVIKI